MPSTNAFAPEEWTLLKELPFKVILAAVVADVRGPIDAAGKETADAARHLVREAKARYPGNALVTAVLSEVAVEIAEDGEIALDDELARRAAIADAIELSKRAARLLAERAAPAEAGEYKEWIYAAAHAAVEASRSGGLLGFGAARVSNEESAFLGDLRAALGLTGAGAEPSS